MPDILVTNDDGIGASGILALATGSGKTVTALALAARLAAGLGNLAIVIVAPYIHLVDQWIENARAFGLRPIRAAEGRAGWEGERFLHEGAAASARRLDAGEVRALSAFLDLL